MRFIFDVPDDKVNDLIHVIGDALALMRVEQATRNQNAISHARHQSGINELDNLHTVMLAHWDGEENDE